MCGIGCCVGARRAGPVLGFALLLLLAGSVGAVAQSVALSEVGGNEVGAPRPKPPPPPPPSSPPARYWHSFTSNGSSVAGGTTCAPGRSRLYLFAGVGEGYKAIDDLWIYCVGGGWSLAPTGKIKPGKRDFVGWSCGAGQCVAANGRSWSLSPLKETWIYDEPSGSWSQLNCRKGPCPSARWGTAIAYDSSRQYYVLFGGEYGGAGLADTHTLQQAAWTKRTPTSHPSARRSAAMAFVPSHGAVVMDKVVLYGGQTVNTAALCDLHTWNGTTWQSILSANHGPCLHSHSMAWVDDVEGLGPGLIVTGGYVDVDDTANEQIWYFLFTSSTSGYWRVGSPLSCDVTPSPIGARMALDAPSQKKLFFGGFDAEQLPNSVPVDTLAVCQ